MGMYLCIGILLSRMCVFDIAQTLVSVLQSPKIKFSQSVLRNLITEYFLLKIKYHLLNYVTIIDRCYTLS